MAVIVGFFLRRYGADIGITIIHEWFHLIACVVTDAYVKEFTTTHVFFSGGNIPVIFAAGYWGECIIFGSIAVLFPFTIVGRLSFGMWFYSIVFEALPSEDFVHIKPYWRWNNEIFVIVSILIMVCFMWVIHEIKKEKI